MLSPIISIEETNFHNAWAKGLKKVLKLGTDTAIGGPEERKPIRDACVLISLTKNAIKQVESRELHPQFSFRSVEHYCKAFTRDFVREYRKGNRKGKFAYLYGDRLIFWAPIDTVEWLPTIDQLSNLRNGLAEQIDCSTMSNRCQAITWVSHIDFGADSPPCLQRISVRWIGGDDVPDARDVDVRLEWRSRDLYGAWPVNVVGVIDMLNREVIFPNNCKIIRIIDYNDSLHIYKTDIVQAKQVNLLPVSPQDITSR